MTTKEYDLDTIEGLEEYNKELKEERIRLEKWAMDFNSKTETLLATIDLLSDLVTNDGVDIRTLH